MENSDHRKRLIAIPVWEIFDTIEEIPMGSRFGSRMLPIPESAYTFKLKRPLIFFDIGTTCTECNVEGTYFALEEDVDGSLHFDLYGRNEEEIPVLMTIDHILPRSKGGPNQVSNYQTMCQPCNAEKGDFDLSRAHIQLIAKASKRASGNFAIQLGKNLQQHRPRVEELVERKLVEITSLSTEIFLTVQGEALLPWARKEVAKWKAKTPIKNKRKRKKHKSYENKT